MMSLTPSFGLNYFSLGGDLTSPAVASDPNLVTKLDRVMLPTRMLVFTSARSAGENGPVWGYFKIVPPTRPFEFSASGWSNAAFTETADPAASGYVHPRWGSSAVTAMLDGHAALQNFESLRDMTRWSDAAARANDPNWRASHP